MQAFDLDKLVANHSPKSVRLKAYLPMILAALDAKVPMPAILEEVNRCTGLDLGINYFSNLVYSWRKEARSQAPQEAAGFPAKTPPAPQANQVAQAPKAPIQPKEGQSSGSPVKEVKAPVSVTEPAKEVKTTLEGKKAEEVKPASESAGKFEFISPVSHLKKEGGCSAEEIIQEMREKDALKELREAVLLASIRKEDFTAEKASRIFQRPVTEEEIPMLLEKANKQFREENADQIRKMEENAKRKAASKLF